MCDEDDGLAVAAHFAQRVEENLGFLRCQDRCGLVQNQDLCAQIDGAENFHSLLLTDGKLPDLAVGINPHMVSVGQRFELLCGLLGVQQNAAAGFLAQHDILHHCQRTRQHKMLVYHADTQRNCFYRG